jgi:hypothetical protein
MPPRGSGGSTLKLRKTRRSPAFFSVRMTIRVPPAASALPLRRIAPVAGDADLKISTAY